MTLLSQMSYMYPSQCKQYYLHQNIHIRCWLLLPTPSKQETSWCLMCIWCWLYKLTSSVGFLQEVYHIHMFPVVSPSGQQWVVKIIMVINILRNFIQVLLYLVLWNCVQVVLYLVLWNCVQVVLYLVLWNCVQVVVWTSPRAIGLGIHRFLSCGI